MNPLVAVIHSSALVPPVTVALHSYLMPAFLSSVCFSFPLTFLIQLSAAICMLSILDILHFFIPTAISFSSFYLWFSSLYNPALERPKLFQSDLRGDLRNVETANKERNRRKKKEKEKKKEKGRNQDK